MLVFTDPQLHFQLFTLQLQALCCTHSCSLLLSSYTIEQSIELPSVRLSQRSSYFTVVFVLQWSQLGLGSGLRWSRRWSRHAVTWSRQWSPLVSACSTCRLPLVVVSAGLGSGLRWSPCWSRHAVTWSRQRSPLVSVLVSARCDLVSAAVSAGLGAGLGTL